MITVALGLIVVLLVSGVIEAFVTPSPLPAWARIGIGGVALTGFIGYVALFGRRAAAAPPGPVRWPGAGRRGATRRYTAHPMSQLSAVATVWLVSTVTPWAACTVEA